MPGADGFVCGGRDRMAQTVPADTHMPDETALAEVRRHVADYNARRMATFRRAL